MKINIGKTELIHFVGIGGIGMSGLALIMNELGFKVQGSDTNMNKNIENCKKLGIKFFLGQKKKNIRENVLNSWLEEFDWLEYNDLHYYFKCNHCDTKFESNNAKKSVFNNHQKSKKHIQNSCVLEIT